MSSKISISPKDIMEAVAALTPGRAPEGDAMQAALALLQARPAPAVSNRVLFYRFDDGPSAQADVVQAQLQGGGTPLHEVAEALDCDLQLIELGRGVAAPEDNARAAAFGMMAAEQHTGLLAVVGFGAGSDSRVADADRFFETATPEVAAMLGAMIGTARAGIPIIAEGPQGLMAARALHAMRADATGHILLCGIDVPAQGFHVFADAAQSETGYPAIMLAAMLQSALAAGKAA